MAYGKAFHYVRAVRPKTGREVMHRWRRGDGGFFFCNWIGTYRDKLLARCGMPDKLRALKIPAEAVTGPG